jgi:hypothetical protein
MEWVMWIVFAIVVGLYIYTHIWHSRELNKKFQPFVDSLFGSRSRDDVTIQSSLLPSVTSRKNRTETLSVGSSAPRFALSAANFEGSLSLADLIFSGPLIVEFLRGTW